MGDPRRLNRKYDVPKMKWNKQKILADKKIIANYGLRRKKEIWKAETEVRKIRKRARLLLAGNVDDYSTRKNELLGKLINLGIFTKDYKIEDILKLNTTDMLDRRLQTLVFKEGLALTPNQARQLITHKHIAVNGKTRTIPGSLITVKETISYTSTKMKNIIEKETDEKGKSKVNTKDDPKKDNVVEKKE
jgi:small subunit ribosomal protein S4